jgi:glycosyltransferase involved in cell wall biosynthesis
MKLMLLGAGGVIHTQRWANGLVDVGVEVLCLSQHEFLPSGWDARVQRERLPRSGIAGYFLNGDAVARWFAQSSCDLLNAHYATGYGVLAMRSGVRPRLVSVWGSDVYDFPAISMLHRALVRRVLHSADGVASTSHAMARQVVRVMAGRPLKREVAITPFGVDTERFGPGPAAAPHPLVIGTVKTLAPKYGIDTLIRAFAMLAPGGSGPVRLCIAGDGPQRAELELLAQTLGVRDRVHFVGLLAHAAVPAQLQGFDIFVAASRLDSESFGVAVVEASACGLPVVVTRVGGLPEVVSEGETGLIVERDDPAALALALQRLIDDGDLRSRLGRNGRARVQAEYEWRASVEHMIGVYSGLLDLAKTAEAIAT